VGKPEGRRLFWRQRRTREDNIKIDIQEVGYESTAWIELAQDRDRCRTFENAVMNHGVPYNTGNFLTA